MADPINTNLNLVENTAARRYATDPTATVVTKLSPIPAISQNLLQDRKIKAKNRDCRGLECLVKVISEFLARIESNVDDIYFGNPLKNTGIKIPGSDTKVNGIYPIVRELSGVDLCNVLNFVTNNLSIQRDIFGERSQISTKIENLKNSSKKLADFIDRSELSPRSILDSDRLREIYSNVLNITTLLDDNVIAAVPQLASTKNFLDDISATINKYTTEPMFSKDVQKVLARIKGLQTAVTSIQSIDTVQDIASLVQNATGFNASKQLANLQKKLNPAELLPAFKQISKALRSFNQIALKVINYVRMLQLTQKAQQFLVKVLTIIDQILTYIPVPLFPLIASVTQILQTALQRIKTFLEKVEKVISQIGRLIDVIFSFILGFVAKVTELDSLVRTIIFNLETCKATKDSPVVEDLKETTSKLADAQTRLNAAVDAYRKAQETPNKRTFNGFTLEIIGEELVDEGIRYRRRKAIALDTRGVLVAETPLTFATDDNILYEELKLILQTRGLIGEESISNREQGLQSEDSLNINDIYESIGFEDEQELKDVGKEVSIEISNFIKGIKKGGRAIQKKLRTTMSKYATQSAANLRSAAATGTLPGVAASSLAVVSKTSNKVDVSTGNSSNKQPLTVEERAKWEAILANPRVSAALKAEARKRLNEGT